MDIDPLADTVPPRHAVESDDEDEYNPLPAKLQANSERKANVQIVGDFSKGKPLVVVTGSAGKTWSNGANLGEQAGAINLNEVQVGFIFTPSWTKATILVSESTTRLPTWCMHVFAEAAIHNLRPNRVALLDTYPAPSYISTEYTPYDDAPLRYLSNMARSLTDDILPFAPPNILQSTSASFITILSAPHPAPADCTLLLLPSPHIPPSPPQHLLSKDTTNSTLKLTEWPTKMMVSAHWALFSCVGENIQQNWQNQESDVKIVHDSSTKMARDQIGDGGMYI